MAGFSTYYAQRLINNDFVNGSTKYLALFIDDPTDNNITANEVTGAWYSRMAVSSWTAPVGTGSSTSNSNQISGIAVTGNTTTVTHWGIYDAATGGNLWGSGAFDEAKVLNVSDVFVANAGTIVLDFI
jgi:hypothetical protein